MKIFLASIYRWVGEKGVDVPHPGISPEADLEPGNVLYI